MTTEAETLPVTAAVVESVPETVTVSAPENLSKSITKALNALIALEQRKKEASVKEAQKGSKKKNLLADEDDYESSSEISRLPLYLTVAMKKIPEKPSVRPHRLSVPHAWKSASSDQNGTFSVCLITKDPHEQYKAQVRALPLPAITKVMSLSKLRTNFKPFEAKRQLAASYDLFLADNRIVPLLPKLLGKKFFVAKKQPVVVDLVSCADLQAELESAIACTHFFLASGPSSCVKIGLAGQGVEALKENCQAVIEQIISLIPGGWAGIKSLHLKSNQSLSLPITN